MNVLAIDRRIETLKNKALESFGLDEETRASVTIAAAPNPDMGDLGFPCFVLARHLKKAPPMIATDVVEVIDGLLTEDDAFIESVSAVGPYVNFTFQSSELSRIVLSDVLEHDTDFGRGVTEEPQHWMIEYSAPNTNKPQHLGHVRNNLLGATVANVLDFAGHDVTRVNLINDRGVHICKSMLAYKLFGDGETPESAGIKGDHLVGKYYVRFAQEFAAEYETWQQTDEADGLFEAWRAEREDDDRPVEALRKAFFDHYEDTYFNTLSSLGTQARDMLLAWESGDAEVVELWNTMNTWVFAGFDATYERLGVSFDRVYRESETYLLGKDIVLQGVEDGKFERLDDGAIACDLEPLGFGDDRRKILLRGDGTSVYTTQDLGTALARFDEYDIDNMVYVVGDEQIYHFKVLFALLTLLRPELTGHLEHLAYGMVLLPEGKMKSREGKVVDADDLIEGMVELARQAVEERYPDLDSDAVDTRSEAIGLAALKFYLMDFNPTTTVHFDPAKSIEFEGRTGPYCLYSYARIQSIARKQGGWPTPSKEAMRALGTELEMDLIKLLKEWPSVVSHAERHLDPGKVSEHVFKICKAFSSLYNDDGHRIREIEGPRRDGLMLLSLCTATVIKTGLNVLGIDVLESM